MLTHAENTALSPSIDGLQLAWDSTSMGDLKLCPRKYYYSVLEGYRPRTESVHLTFGIIYHEALERYDHAKAQGRPYEEACRVAVRHALQATWSSKLRRPWLSDDPNKNRGTLLRTIVWYLDQFKEDPIETILLANGKPAVELSFRFALPYDSGEGPFLYCGHLDRLGSLGGRSYIIDRKTTKHTLGEAYFAQYSPDNQFSGYIFSGQLAFNLKLDGLICDAAQVMVGGSRFQREVIARTPDQTEEWVKDLGYWLQMALGYAKAGYWPQNDKACNIYGGCAFRGVCSKAPSVRKAWLEQGFEKRVWDPLQVRGDI